MTRFFVGEREASERHGECVRVEPMKEIMIRGMARRATDRDAEQLQRLWLQPPAPSENRSQIVGASEHRRDGDAEHRAQRILPALAATAIRHFCQCLPQRACRRS